ncbi:MAG: cytochrome-c peroxidase [Niabella sp.]
MKQYIVVAWLLGALLTLGVACSKSGDSTATETGTTAEEDDDGTDTTNTRSLREQYATTPSSWPAASWYDGITGRQELATLQSAPSSDSLGVDKVALGETMFFDARLSDNTILSCSFCHRPASSYADHLTLSVTGQTRNPPTLQNVWYLNGNLFHDV